MKHYLILAGCLLLARLAAAQTPLIEVEACFVEITESAAADLGIRTQWAENEMATTWMPDSTDTVARLKTTGGADRLSAPKIRAFSGSNATVKVVREHRYPTTVDIRTVAVTNGTEVERTVAVVPSGFEVITEGVTLRAAPVYDARRDTIDLQLDAEVAETLDWQEYTIPYEGPDGKPRFVKIPQPIRSVRSFSPQLTMANHQTVVMGGLLKRETRRIEDRVPVLGAIPGLGRLFRHTHEVEENRHLLILVTAGTVD